MGTDNESELQSSVLSVAYDAVIYDGEEPESALDCIRQELDGYSKLMWRIQRLCHADSARPDDVEASIQKLVSAKTTDSTVPDGRDSKRLDWLESHIENLSRISRPLNDTLTLEYVSDISGCVAEEETTQGIRVAIDAAMRTR